MQLQFSESNTEAYVVAVPPDFGGGRDITSGNFKAALTESGIVEGICDDALASLAEILSEGEGYSGKPILVARGKPPQPGKDGKLVLLPPAKVDLSKSKRTWLVFPGEKVATIDPPTRGEAGINVRGEKIPGELGKDAEVNLGTGVELGRNGKDIVANIAGFVRVELKRISVECPVTVAKNKMTAYLNVMTPARVIGALGVDDYYKLLRTSGVVHGISKETLQKAIKAASDTGEDKNAVIVARGTEPKRGEDARIEYNFSLDVKPGLLLPDGKMDYRERELIQNVAAGQQLAVKIPPKPGKPGTTVTGEPVPAQPGRDMPLKALENVALSEDTLKLVAKREGMAVRDRSGGVRVITEFEIPGDVDYSTGNVRCKGTIRIEGSVLPNFSVESEQDVLIDGGVDSANVYAGGNLFVAHGIQGSPETEIVAGGDIRALFIENATVSAKGDIIIGQSVRHSDVRTTGTIKVTEKRGAIAGGTVVATCGIIANEVGSELGTRTELVAGIDAFKSARLEMFEKKIDEHEATIRRLDVQLGPAVDESKKMVLTAGKKSWLAKLLSERALVVAERDKVVEQRDKLASEIRSDLSAKVRVLGKVYSGVVVKIGEAAYSVGDSVRNVSFLYDEEHLEIACVQETC